MGRSAWLAVLGVVAGCSSDAVKHEPYPDVSGYYFAQLESGPSTCPGDDWTPGETFPIDIMLTQHALVLTVEVLYSTTLGSLVGAHTFPGMLDTLQLEGSLEGDKPQTSGACTYTFDATLAATVSVNTLSGSITYAAQTDCAPVAGCTRVQNLTGERNPTGMDAPN
jgi:hypothetical protein